MKVWIFLILSVLLKDSLSVDRNNFKTCDQSSFCRRCRKVQPDNSPYELVPATLNTYSDSITSDLVNKENGHLFVFKLEAVKGNTFRVLIDEKTPLKTRYRVKDALKSEPISDTIKVTENNNEVIVTAGTSKAVVHATPFRIDFFNNDVLTVSANAKGLFKFEHLRKKPAPKANVENADGENQEAQHAEANEEDDPGAWEENFKSHHDSKPNGPEAVALDFSFPQAQVIFGVPEHAESFALKATANTDPYRLYNLDVFEYELYNGMSLYGAIPLVYGHGGEHTAGVYWQNAAETWIDIYNPNTEKNVLSSLVNMVSGSGNKDPIAAHFISEAGIVDAFILLGPGPLDVFKQYTDLTGVAPLPQMFALGYHQCRWNYNDEQDVNSVSNKFDEHDIPMDTMWLDIEYTDSKKYFTWDQHKFGHSLEMIHNLTALGRHLTIIIDPHIKRDGSYFFHNDCTDRGYYTKTKDGSDYDGWCWPGSASYPDLFDPAVRKYFADQYLLENFQTTTADVMIWNDMNEPSVFNGPEVTMPKDNVHYEGYEHRHVHNIYGHMQLVSTFDGLSRRSNHQQRPFILTRSHFAGSQRYATIWTGDNFAEWGHLAISVKMCLTEAVAGFSFCGADVGGFFGNPDVELLERWYQAGSFQPFFRAHAHIDTKRREPWLFPEPTKLKIREAIRRRYSYLPMWYTLFYEHERNGLPVMRPLLAHYPKDSEAFTIDYEYLLGDRLLVRPVVEQGVTKVDVYFPRHTENGSGDLWYDVDDWRRIDSVGLVSIPVDDRKIPVYQRGGSIIPKKERIRRASTLMINDPYTFVVALDRSKSASGTLYLDDEKSYEYRNGKYVYLQLKFENDVLSSDFIDPKATYETQSWVERVVLVGLDRVPKSATLKIAGSSKVETLEVHQEGNAVVVRKPGVSVLEKFSITLNY